MSTTWKYFDPNKPVCGETADGHTTTAYQYHDDRIVAAVNIAIAARRPLLVLGPSGSGKSTLAADVAHRLGWRFYDHVVTSRTEVQDLLWSVDEIRRLRDAQRHAEVSPLERYVEPGVLWWAFDRELAQRRGLEEEEARKLAEKGQDNDGMQYARERAQQSESDCAVVLIDEIDKADRSVPNGLLVPFGTLSFHATSDREVKAKGRVLLIVTSNEERALPAAFMRRCIVLRLEPPESVDDLLSIAKAHISEVTTNSQLEEIAKTLAEYVVSNRVSPRSPDTVSTTQASLSTAEYVDAVRACKELEITPDSERWQTLLEVVFDNGRTDHRR